MVERFPINDFCSFLVDFERDLSGLEVVFRPVENPAAKRQFYETAMSYFQQHLAGLLSTCDTSEVTLSHAVVMQIRDFQERLKIRGMGDIDATLEHARLVRQAVLYDLSEHLFLHVEYERSHFYSKPRLGWEAVSDRFGCAFDIEEARKCIALGRDTAAVFHLMKVVEKAVLELQVFLEDRDVKAHFGSVIAKLERMTQQTKYDHVPTNLKPFLPFMREVLTQLHSVKDSWRDKVAHVDERIVPIETFTPELSKDVHDATLSLMKKLVAGLPSSTA